MEHQPAQYETIGTVDHGHDPIGPTADLLAQYRDARMSRVIDYLDQSLSQEDALSANLGSFNSGLMQTLLSVEEGIGQAIGSDAVDPQQLAALAPAIEMQLKLARQIDRFAQLEFRTREDRQSNSSDGARDQTNVATIPEAEDVSSDDAGV